MAGQGRRDARARTSAPRWWSPCLLSQVGDDLDRFAIGVSDAYRDHNGGFRYLEGNPSSYSLAVANDSTVEYWLKVGPERAGVRPSTVSRWVQSRRLAAGRLPTGELQIEDGVLDEFLALRTASPRSGLDATVELAVAQERIRGLEALVASQRSWLEESEARLQMVLQALPPPPPARRPWWRRW